MDKVEPVRPGEIATPPAVPPGSVPARAALFHPRENTFAEDLQKLIDTPSTRAMTVGGLEQALKGRGFAVLVILLAAPFVLPVQIPGLSMPFALAIAIIGVRIGFGLKPWLPAFILRREIKHSHLARLLRAALRIARPMEKVVRPRWGIFFTPGVRNLHGWAIVVAAVLLFLPLPIPGTNMIAAFPIILVAAGLMERDGLFSFCGYISVLIVLGMFVMLGVLGTGGVQALWQHFFGHPVPSPATMPAASWVGLIRAMA